VRYLGLLQSDSIGNQELDEFEDSDNAQDADSSVTVPENDVKPTAAE
jgi:hypothetical protein